MKAHPQSSPASGIHPVAPSSAPAPAPLSPSIAQGAGLAHDAANFLGALNLYAELLSLPGVLGPEHKSYAAELQLLSERSSTLILRLMQNAGLWNRLAETNSATLTALQKPPVAVQSEAIVTSATLQKILPILQRIASTVAEVSLACPPSLPLNHLPSETLERIVLNLVRNAADAIGRQHLPQKAGVIRIALHSAGGRLQLSVADNGPGMPPAIAAAFLNPFVSPPLASRGMGHRIIHELVNESHGHLSINVRHGQGTVFTIEWPLDSEETPNQIEGAHAA
jgi:signal transduction histidine kinase